MTTSPSVRFGAARGLYVTMFQRPFLNLCARNRHRIRGHVVTIPSAPGLVKKAAKNRGKPSILAG
jgi:hypothetical protein